MARPILETNTSGDQGVGNKPCPVPQGFGGWPALNFPSPLETLPVAPAKKRGEEGRLYPSEFHQPRRTIMGYGSMGFGVGASSAVATVGGRMIGPGGRGSQGEIPGAGTRYSVTLNERPNMSNTRNQGPEGNPAGVFANGFPMVTAAERNTGRIRLSR